jgi:hypothetical protein
MEDVRDMLGPFWPGRLFEEPRAPDSPLYWVVLAIFVAVFIAGLVMWVGARRWSQGNRIHHRIFDLYGQWAAGLGGAGMIIVLLRYAHVPLFSKRLWTFLNLVAILLVAAHYARYRMREYPTELATYLEEERKRRFFPTPRRARPSRRTLHRAR